MSFFTYRPPQAQTGLDVMNQSMLGKLPGAAKTAAAQYGAVEGSYPGPQVGAFVEPGLKRTAERLETGGMSPAEEETQMGGIRRNINAMLGRIRGDRPGGAGFSAAAGGAGIPDVAGSALAQLEARRAEIRRAGTAQAGQLYGGAFPSVMSEMARRRSAYGQMLGQISGKTPPKGTLTTGSPWI